jgi:hypothetical protein
VRQDGRRHALLHEPRGVREQGVQQRLGHVGARLRALRNVHAAGEERASEREHARARPRGASASARKSAQGHEAAREGGGRGRADGRARDCGG